MLGRFKLRWLPILAVIGGVTATPLAAAPKSRVIVTMKLPATAKQSEFDTMHRRIAAAVKARGATEVRRFKQLPQSLWLVTSEGRRALQAHPDVLRVQADGLSRPNELSRPN